MYLILVMIAAFFYSVNQTVEHHFSTSVFKKLNPNFWNGQVSWSAATKLFGSYPWDAAHISASLMLVFWALAAILSQKPVWTWEIGLLKWYYQVGIVGIVWIIVFNIFFNKVLVSAKT